MEVNVGGIPLGAPWTDQDIVKGLSKSKLLGPK